VTEPTIQVFGLEKDQSTRAALRFFKERRVPISFVDLRKRPMAPAELRRFVERLGAGALLDETSKAYRDGGLAYLRKDEDDIVSRLLVDQSLLRLPLVRDGTEVTAGRADTTWRAWLTMTASRQGSQRRNKPADRAFSSQESTTSTTTLEG
jgi:arsenate reductase (glutaredoxin)